MKLTKEDVIKMFSVFSCPCDEICETHLYNEDYDDNQNSLCGLCCMNNQQFFVPTQDFVNKVNELLEEK